MTGEPKLERIQRFDYTILMAALALMGIGLITIYSASCILAHERFGDPFHFLKKQVVFAVAGLCLMLVIAHIPYEKYRPFVYPALGVAMVLLVAVLIPLGQSHSRANRWLTIGGFTFQPSEPAKLALVLYMAHSLAKKRERGTIKTFFLGFFPHAVSAGAMMLLLFKEPDLGGTLIVGAVAFTMMFLAGVRLRHLMLCLIPGAVLLLHKIHGYQWERIETFLKYFMAPWEASLKEAYHLKQACYALANGGVVGMGLGMGRQKLFYLPEPHTDFIFAVIGEEWGFLGISIVCLLFIALILGGAKVALAIKDSFGSLLAMGIVVLIGMQAVANMAVAVGLLPTKGMALPLVSYGGSSLIVNLMAIGVLIHLSGRIQRGEEDS